MNSLYIDCSMGVAGDMLLASFYDLGVPKDIIEQPLLDLGLGKKFNLKVVNGNNLGFRGKKLFVENIGTNPTKHSWSDIRELIIETSWEDSLKEKVLQVFGELAEAESIVHGKSIDNVHFHEIGLIDSLVDVVGVCKAVEYLKPKHIICSFPPSGSGTIKTCHGVLPVPVPVVLELAKKHQIEFSSLDLNMTGELTTPTGMALIAVLANKYGHPSSFGLSSIGIGLGKKIFNHPNFLRVCEIQFSENISIKSESDNIKLQTLIVQETWIDDSTPEDLSVLVNTLRSSGAIEVITQSAIMKQGRNGVSIKALVFQSNAENLRNVWFSHSTTLGIREHIQNRWLLPRRRGTCKTLFGILSAKQLRRPNGKITMKFEHKDLSRISNEKEQSINYIRDEALKTAEEFIPEEEWQI